MIGNAKRNYDGKCGTCSYFAFCVKNGDTRAMGRCCHPNRVSYHDASQKACKEYKKERELLGLKADIVSVDEFLMPKAESEETIKNGF